MNTATDQLKDKLPSAKSNIVLRDFTTMAVGGVADLFYVTSDIIELTNAIAEAIKLQIPYLVIGGGSNIIISDSGFPGLVIKNETQNIIRIPETSQLIIDSGVTVNRLMSKIVQEGLTGIEFIAGIPGTIGGAVYGNIGAWGQEFGSFVQELTIFHPPKSKNEEPKIIKHQVSWLEYSYRSSKIKRLYKNKSLELAKPVILTTKIGLAPAKKEDILTRINEYKEKRQNQPKEKSAGCIFVNPERTAQGSAGALIDQAKLKKTRIGDAMVSPIHANFIVNRGRATASDIRALIEKVRHDVNEKFGITLEEEVEYVGRW